MSPTPATNTTLTAVESAIGAALAVAAPFDPFIAIAAAAEPAVAGLISSVMALRTKYPALTADQIVAMVQSITATNDIAANDALAAIAADKAAHPGT